MRQGALPPEIALTRLQLAELLLEVSEGRLAAPLATDSPGREAEEVGTPRPSPLPKGEGTDHPPRPLGEGRGEGRATAIRKEALEHLDFAIAEFQEMKMQPSLERALRHKGILKA